MALAMFLMEGLTIVCMIGTAVLVGVFAFLFVVERKMDSKNTK